MLKKKIWKPLAGIVFLITLASAALAVLALIRIDILPEEYLLVILAVEALALLVAALLLYVGMRRKRSRARQARRVIGIFFCLVLAAGNLFAASVLTDLGRTRDVVVEKRDHVALVGVYVSRDDAAQTLADTASYRYGVLGGFEKGTSDYVLSQLSGRLGGTVGAQEYESISAAVTALRGGEVRALAVNGNYLDLLGESEDFGGLSEELRLLETLEVPLDLSAGSEAAGAGTDGSSAAGSSAGSLFGSRLPSRPARSEQPSAAEKVEKDKCIVLYLSGNDALTSALTTGRSDVNILMLINPATDQILLVNTPRDYYVPNPALGGGMDKLTHCGLFGTYNSMAALEALYGVEIDNYCQINFTGFEKLVDALGGITLDNPRAFYSTSGYFFPEGEITLDGVRALSYGRERDAFGDGDLARGRNLMRLITALIDKAKSSGASLLMNYPSILDSLEGMFATDLSSEEISALVKLAIRDLNSWEVLSTSVSGDGGIMRTAAGGDVPLYVMRPDMEQVARASGLIERLLAGERLREDELG